MASPTSPANTAAPSRAFTNGSEEDAILGEDTSEVCLLRSANKNYANADDQVTKLFHERLLAWKHACGCLEDYINATHKMHEHQAKEYEKVLKVRIKCYAG